MAKPLYRTTIVKYPSHQYLAVFEKIIMAKRSGTMWTWTIYLQAVDLVTGKVPQLNIYIATG